MIYSYMQILKVARKQANQIGCVENHFNSRMMTGTNETIGTSQNGTISFGNNDSKHFVSRSLKSLKIVSIIIGTFFLCWGPYIGFNFWCLDNAKPIPYLGDLLTTFLAFTNSSVNPYLIIMFNRDFKIAFRNIFKSRQQE
ncbi:octopamine receptor beta-2R-like isoform X1 [Octopus vulgaris]|uniref:Octopamine receptor beta-2R-like isoform X1 n=1 Tax=Octopus vulgaris TaxID=6645 RepID=A0AA36BTG9_OCTVU|nr:octopamine receptor beta-2R-like isoform X1 [Octopus vulgaris]